MCMIYAQKYTYTLIWLSNVVYSLQKMAVFQTEPMVPLSIDQNQRCLPGAGTWLPPSPWRCSSTFPELSRCSHLCHQISGEGEPFSPGPEQPELGKLTFSYQWVDLHLLLSAQTNILWILPFPST